MKLNESPQKIWFRLVALILCIVLPLTEITPAFAARDSEIPLHVALGSSADTDATNRMRDLKLRLNEMFIHERILSQLTPDEIQQLQSTGFGAASRGTRADKKTRAVRPAAGTAKIDAPNPRLKISRRFLRVLFFALFYVGPPWVLLRLPEDISKLFSELLFDVVSVYFSMEVFTRVIEKVAFFNGSIWLKDQTISQRILRISAFVLGCTTILNFSFMVGISFVTFIYNLLSLFISPFYQQHIAFTAPSVLITALVIRILRKGIREKSFKEETGEALSRFKQSGWGSRIRGFVEGIFSVFIFGASLIFQTDFFRYFYIPIFYGILPWSVTLQNGNSIRVHGISQDKISPAQMTYILNALPDQVYDEKNPDRINFYAYPPEIWHYGGFYSDSEKWWRFLPSKIFTKIFLAAYGGNDLQAMNLWHEQGHHVYAAEWFHARRERWEELYEKYRKDPKRFVLTQYSLKNAGEGFAEWFAYFTRDNGHRILEYMGKGDDVQKEMWLIIASVFLEDHEGRPVLQINFPETQKIIGVQVRLDNEGNLTANELKQAVQLAQRVELGSIVLSWPFPLDRKAAEKMAYHLTDHMDPLLENKLKLLGLIATRDDILSGSIINASANEIIKVLNEMVLRPVQNIPLHEMAVSLLLKIGDESSTPALLYYLRVFSTDETREPVYKVLKQMKSPEAKKAISDSFDQVLKDRQTVFDNVYELKRLDFLVMVYVILGGEHSILDRALLEDIIRRRDGFDQIDKMYGKFWGDEVYRYLREIDKHDGELPPGQRPTRGGITTGFGVVEDADLYDQIIGFHRTQREKFKTAYAKAHPPERAALNSYEDDEREKGLENTVARLFDETIVHSSADDHFQIAAMENDPGPKTYYDAFYWSLTGDYLLGWYASVILDRLKTGFDLSDESLHPDVLLNKIIGYLTPTHSDNVIEEAYALAEAHLPKDFDPYHTHGVYARGLLKGLSKMFAEADARAVRILLQRRGASHELLNEVMQMFRLHRDFLIARSTFLMRLATEENYSYHVRNAFNRFEVNVQEALRHGRKPPYLVPVGFGMAEPALPMIDIHAATLVVNGKTLKIIPMTPELLQSKRRLFFELFKLMDTDIYLNMVEHVDQFAFDSKKMNPKMSFAVLNEAGEPIASAALADSTTGVYKPGESVYLRMFTTHPDFQGTGVAAWLLYQALARAKELGYKHAEWVTTLNSKRAIHFYEKIGAARAEEPFIRPQAEIENVPYVVFQAVIDTVLPRLASDFQSKQVPAGFGVLAAGLLDIVQVSEWLVHGVGLGIAIIMYLVFPLTILDLIKEVIHIFALQLSIKTLKNSQAPVDERLAAIRRLSPDRWIKPPLRTKKIVVAMLTDREPAIRSAAREILLQYFRRKYESPIGSHYEVDVARQMTKASREYSEDLGEYFRPYLESILNDSMRFVKKRRQSYFYAEAADLFSKPARPVEDRRLAAQAIARLLFVHPEWSWDTKISEVLKDEDAEVRRTAVRAMRELMRRRKVVRPLFLNDIGFDSVFEGEHTIDTAGIISALGDSDAEVRQTATLALAGAFTVDYTFNLDDEKILAEIEKGIASGVDIEEYFEPLEDALLYWILEEPFKTALVNHHYRLDSKPNRLRLLLHGMNQLRTKYGRANKPKDILDTLNFSTGMDEFWWEWMWKAVRESGQNGIVGEIIRPVEISTGRPVMNTTTAPLRLELEFRDAFKQSLEDAYRAPVAPADVARYLYDLKDFSEKMRNPKFDSQIRQSLRGLYSPYQIAVLYKVTLALTRLRRYDVAGLFTVKDEDKIIRVVAKLRKEATEHLADLFTSEGTPDSVSLSRDPRAADEIFGNFYKGGMDFEIQADETMHDWIGEERSVRRLEHALKTDFKNGIRPKGLPVVFHVEFEKSFRVYRKLYWNSFKAGWSKQGIPALIFMFAVGTSSIIFREKSAILGSCMFLGILGVSTLLMLGMVIKFGEKYGWIFKYYKDQWVEHIFHKNQGQKLLESFIQKNLPAESVATEPAGFGALGITNNNHKAPKKENREIRYFRNKFLRARGNRQDVALKEWLIHEPESLATWLTYGLKKTIEEPSDFDFFELPRRLGDRRRDSFSLSHKVIAAIFSLDNLISDTEVRRQMGKTRLRTFKRSLRQIYSMFEWPIRAYPFIDGTIHGDYSALAEVNTQSMETIFSNANSMLSQLGETNGYFETEEPAKILEAQKTAFLETPRHLFMPRYLKESAYGDHPNGIGHGQTISQPSLMAFLLMLLNLKPTDNVLEVGAGSGWFAALMSRKANHVHATELIPELAKKAEGTIAKMGIRNVTVIASDGTLGYPEAGPYDAIVVSAGSPHISTTLWNQLAEGGRLVAPVYAGSFREKEYYKFVLVVKENGKPVVKARPSITLAYVPLLGMHGWTDAVRAKFRAQEEEARAQAEAAEAAEKAVALQSTGEVASTDSKTETAVAGFGLKGEKPGAAVDLTFDRIKGEWDSIKDGTTLLITDNHPGAERVLFNMPPKMRAAIFRDVKNVMVVLPADSEKAWALAKRIARLLSIHEENAHGFARYEELGQEENLMLLRRELFQFGKEEHLPPIIRHLRTENNVAIAGWLEWLDKQHSAVNISA